MLRPLPVYATRRRGFSLVLSLTVMAMLLLLCISIAALMSVEVRVARASVVQARARMNAVVAARTALGEIQRLAGPDRRVTANALILDENTDPTKPATRIKQPRLLGVWQGGTVVRDYDAKRTKAFRGWLTSGAPVADGTAAPLQFAALTTEQAVPGTRQNSPESRFNVAEPLLAAPATAPVSPAFFVDKDAVAVSAIAESIANDFQGSDVAGRFAWWVSDENQKAALNLRRDVSGKVDPITLALASRDNAPRYALERADDGDLANFPYNQPLLSEYLTRDTLMLERKDPANPGSIPWMADARPYFHHVSPGSVTLFTDCANGGLRYDLSQIWALRRELPVPYGNDPQKTGAADFIGLEWKVNSGAQNLYAQAKRGWADALTALDSRWSEMLADNEEEWPTWYDLWQYGNLHHIDDGVMQWNSGKPVLRGTNLTDATGKNTISGDLATQDPSRFAAYREPLIAQIQFMYGLRTKMEGTKQNLYLTATPLLQLWNPNNLPLALPSDANDQLCISTLKLGTHTSVYLDGVLYKDANNKLATTIGTTLTQVFPKEMMMVVKPPAGTVLKPGEVMLFSPEGGVFYGDSTYIPLVPGNNPTGGFEQRPIGDMIVDVASAGIVGIGVNAVWDNTNSTGTYPPILLDQGRMGQPGSWFGNRLTGRAVRTVLTKSATPGSNMLDLEGGQGATPPSVNNPTGGFTVEKPIGLLSPGSSQPTMYAYLTFRQKSEQDSGPNAASPEGNASRFGIWGDPARGWMRFFDGAATSRGSAVYQKWMSPMECFMTKVTSAVDTRNRVSARLGTGTTDTTGVPAMILAHAPVANLATLGQLRHARLGGGAAYQRNYPYGWRDKRGRLDVGRPPENTAVYSRDGTLMRAGYSVVWDAFGNSWAHPFIPASGVAYDLPELTEPRTGTNLLAQQKATNNVMCSERLYDYSWIMNTAIWDSWFVSTLQADVSGRTIIPEQDQNTDSHKLAREFFAGAKKLRNPRILPIGAADPAKLDLIGEVSPVTQPRVEAAFKVAAAMALQDGFNINSTSVRAWRSLLDGMKDADFLRYDGDAVTARTASAPIVTPGQVQKGEPAVTPTDHVARMTSGRRLTSAQLDSLAVEIVRQVRRRGPFLSLGEFVNRRLDATELGRSGAVQSAIDRTDINEPLKAFGSAVAAPIKSNAINANALLAADDREHRAGVGLPGYVRQADVISPLASSLTARGDTFTVRVMGEVTGDIPAKAWCELTVRRSINFVDESNEPGTPLNAPKLTAANKAFGRRCEIVGVRWLSSSEI